jgi:RecA/RadA recombinase
MKVVEVVRDGKIVEVHRESGPSCSGKTTRLVALANEAAAKGGRVAFRTVEHSHKVLRGKFGLRPEVEVKIADWDPDLDADEQEWVTTERPREPVA